MSKLVLSGDTSGSVTLESPAVSGTTTLTLPTTTGTLVVTSGAQTIEFADGSASTPSITNSGNTNTGIFFSAADTIDFTEGGTAVGQFDSSANFKFNSGYGSVATAYGCRAWVLFDGTASGTWAGGTSTVTRASGSTTATITTTTAHNLITGNQVWALTGVAAGAYTVTVTSATVFTITTVATTALTNASITFAINSIKGSGNVSSVTDNGTGNHTVNFATAMPDTNYSYTFGVQAGSNIFAFLDSSSASAAPTLKSQYAIRFTSQSSAGNSFDTANTCAMIFR
jgi:hypothetical protein